MEDHRKYQDKSVIAWGDKLCKEYTIGPVSSVYTDKTTIKSLIRHNHNMRVLSDCVLSSAVRHRLTFRVIDKSYQTLEKLESKALILWRTGALKFKSSWRVYNSKKDGGISCVSRLCLEEDSWEHMTQCQFYNTKFNSDWKTDKELAMYLVKVNQERVVRFHSPLF